jgi:branched-chain amino acid transport system ATP-binding protein
MQLTKQLAHQQNIGVLFTEHSMDVVFDFADKIIVLARGQVIASGNPSYIQNHQLVQEVYFGKKMTQQLQQHS